MGKRSSHYRRQSRTQSRKRVVRKQSTLGLRLLLVGVLLAMGVWLLLRVPPHIVLLVIIAILLTFILILAVWFALRYRPTPEERTLQQDQRVKLMHMEDTAQAVGVRLIELQDLAYLTKGTKGTEFEDFTIALLEAMGVASELERVGGAGDRGIDLLGKNRFGLPFVAQCKHYFGHPVVPKETRDFGWAMSLHGSRDAWFVTTSTFTSQARHDVLKLTSPGHMVLVDGNLLISFIREHWDALPHRWQWRLTQCMVQRDR